jgi:hypothetical protein
MSSLSSRHPPEIQDLIHRGILDDNKNPMPGYKEVWHGTIVHLVKDPDYIQPRKPTQPIVKESKVSENSKTPE